MNKEEIVKIITEQPIEAYFPDSSTSYFDISEKEAERLADAIMSLPNPTIDKIREYCEKRTNLNTEVPFAKEESDLTKHERTYDLGVKHTANEILSILNSAQDEKFDVKGWLKESVRTDARFRDFDTHIRYYGSNPLYVVKFYLNAGKLRIKSSYMDSSDETIYDGTIPTSLSFWLQLLKNLGINLN